MIGHHLEYLDHVSEYVARSDGGTDRMGTGQRSGRLSQERLDVELHMAVHPAVEERRPVIADRAETHPSVSLHPLTRQECAAIEEAPLLREGEAMWEALSRIVQAANPNHCVFMEINPLQLILGMPAARRADFNISGILFFPFPRIEPASTQIWDRIRSRIERGRKYLQLRWMLANSQVRHLFVLNDDTAAQELRETYHRDCFTSLPDPVTELVEDGSEEPQKLVGGPASWADGRYHITLFGSLRREKGVQELLSAAERLPEEVAEQVALHLLGAARDDIVEELPRLVRSLQKTQPCIQVQLEDRFLSDRELHAALSATDVVAAPYQRTEGSSGVLGHAAKYRCPIIGPETGLMGELIQTYQLGLNIDTTRPEAIAGAIRTFVRSESVHASKQGMSEYVAERCPEAFAERLIETVIGDTNASYESQSD